MRRRPVFAVTLVMAVLVSLGATTAAQAAPGALRILVDSNIPSAIDSGLVPAIQAEPGVATVDTFDSSAATPSQATLDSYDLVVDNGDESYSDPVTYGNELANYLNSGGALIQFTFDNWDSSGAFPTGEFALGGYAPFVPGPQMNSLTTLGTLAPSPLLTGVTGITTQFNTTDALAPGATLLATWADGRNAIATKGRVESVTASLDSGTFTPISQAAQLIVNAANVLGRQALTVTKTGTGSGTVVSSPVGINCGATCTFAFPANAQVTLTAAPASGSTGSLTGAGCSGGTTCTVTVSSATAVTATFSLIPPPPLTRPHGTKISKSKINKKKHTASFRFSALGTVAKFQCALLPPKKKGHKKPKLVFRACSSPKLYKHLKHGTYKFEVRAANAAGPDLKLAIRKFTI